VERLPGRGRGRRLTAAANDSALGLYKNIWLV
jgi:hypothetical protein